MEIVKTKGYLPAVEAPLTQVDGWEGAVVRSDLSSDRRVSASYA
jgi:hypothetical protein